jgi:DNA/RNA endonuclease YhcR with UshA esterase domain
LYDGARRNVRLGRLSLPSERAKEAGGVGLIRKIIAAASLAALVPATAAQAHHSFAVYFDPGKTVTITGKVTAFRFTNPHGLIVLDVTGADGKVSEWRAETNAPVVLTRRGWTRDAIKPGETITIEGWASRDGKPYIRLRAAKDAQGKLIGTAPFGVTDDG